MAKSHLKKANKDTSVKDRVKIRLYTDPLCCWSWAFEPHWTRFREDFAEVIEYQYCMGGMIPDWESFNDPLNTVSKPAHLGPIWMECRHISGVHNDDKIWIEDPPASSFPSCIAVKCASLQSPKAEELYLYEVRKAAMTERKNIAKFSVLLEVGKRLEAMSPEIFDYNKFKDDLSSDRGTNLFREDLNKSRYLGISRFPALTFNREGKEGLMAIGYRPYEALVDALSEIAPEWVVVNKQ